KPDTQNRGARGRKDIEYLKFFGIRCVSPRHPLITQEELWEKRQIKSDKNKHGGDFAPEFRVHFPRHLWPPVVNTSQIGDHLSANHDIVEMGDNKIGIRQVHDEPYGSKEKAGQSANQKQAHKAEAVEHR